MSSKLLSRCAAKNASMGVGGAATAVGGIRVPGPEFAVVLPGGGFSLGKSNAAAAAIKFPLLNWDLKGINVRGLGGCPESGAAVAGTVRVAILLFIEVLCFGGTAFFGCLCRLDLNVPSKA